MKSKSCRKIYSLWKFLGNDWIISSTPNWIRLSVWFSSKKINRDCETKIVSEWHLNCTDGCFHDTLFFFCCVERRKCSSLLLVVNWGWIVQTKFQMTKATKKARRQKISGWTYFSAEIIHTIRDYAVSWCKNVSCEIRNVQPSFFPLFATFFVRFAFEWIKINVAPSQIGSNFFYSWFHLTKVPFTLLWFRFVSRVRNLHASYLNVCALIVYCDKEIVNFIWPIDETRFRRKMYIIVNACPKYVSFDYLTTNQNWLALRVLLLFRIK